MRKLYIPVPDGWTRVDAADSITVSGTVPDTAEQRNCSVTIVLKLRSDGALSWRGGKYSVRRERMLSIWDYKTRTTLAPAWRRAGKGGAALLGTLLHTLASGGEVL